jgi:hypothetical protein
MKRHTRPLHAQQELDDLSPNLLVMTLTGLICIGLALLLLLVEL